jgi:desulfoferrodoxin (superoxide reductase-like protein)
MVVVLLVGLMTTPAIANKASLQIEAPTEVSSGTTITIKLNVMHEGNNWFHYTNWVRVTVNGSELKRWEFSRRNRPENENFTITVTYEVTAPIEIVAEANCNLHGSEGPATVTVNVK